MRKHELVGFLLLLGISTFGMIRPLFRSQVLVDLNNESPVDWPVQFMGAELVSIPLTKSEQSFYAGFPGQAAHFQIGTERLILRKVNQATRKLHPAQDCFKGIGYTVVETGLILDAYERVWSSFQACKGTVSLEVAELITDEAGNTWSDISAWYWAVLQKKTLRPWTSYVRIRNLDLNSPDSILITTPSLNRP